MNNKNVKDKNLQPLNKEQGLLLFDLSVALLIIFSLVYGLITQSVKVNENVQFYLSFLFSPVCMALALLVLNKRTSQNVICSIPLCKPQKKHVLGVALIAVGLLFGLSEVNALFCNFLYDLFGYVPSPIMLPEKSFINVILTVIFICVLPPLFEEVVFRGVILGSFNNFTNVKKIILTGALFSLFHMSPMQTVYQFMVGCVYALIVIKSKNVALTVFAHVFNNLYIILCEYFFKFSLEGVWQIVVIISGLLLLALGLIIFIKDKTGETGENAVAEKGGKKYISIGVIICAIMWVANLLVGAV